MQQELQAKIIGYYIEETKDHLNIIEQNLMNLPSKEDDRRIIDALVCASNSLAGGAAMLGIESICKTSCCLKSCFQVLQLEEWVKVDRKLKNLFMQVFALLRELVEHLSQPSGLTDAKAEVVMAKIEPRLQAINDHLALLIHRSNDKNFNFDDELIALFDDFC